MEWTELNIYTTTEGIDIICSNLMDIGVKGFAIKDAEDFDEFLQNKDRKWDYIDDKLMELSNCETCITIYLPNNSQGAEMLISVKSMLSSMYAKDTDNVYGRLETEFSNIREEDWANNWKQYFKPLNIGEKLLIKPSWEKCENLDGRTILEIDPASSFGTGQHHTTQLCLELLEKSLKPCDKQLDLGCGSGILSIAGVLLGAESAVAVDIEQNAVETAIENAKRNNIPAEKYTAYCGNILADEKLVEKIDDKYDIVTANIVADVLIAMSSLFNRFLKKNGVLIISGIIEERMDEVIESVEKSGFEVSEKNIKKGWAAVTLIKK